MLSGNEVQFVVLLEEKVYRVTQSSRLRLTYYSTKVPCYGGSFYLFSVQKVKVIHHFWQRKVAEGFRCNLLFVTKYMK